MLQAEFDEPCNQVLEIPWGKSIWFTWHWLAHSPTIKIPISHLASPTFLLTSVPPWQPGTCWWTASFGQPAATSEPQPKARASDALGALRQGSCSNVGPVDTNGKAPMYYKTYSSKITGGCQAHCFWLKYVEIYWHTHTNTSYSYIIIFCPIDYQPQLYRSLKSISRTYGKK